MINLLRHEVLQSWLISVEISINKGEERKKAHWRTNDHNSQRAVSSKYKPAYLRKTSQLDAWRRTYE